MSRAESPEGPLGTTSTRVRYPETDRMGVAHHTHFLVWFELGRTELMRDLGCTYGALEEKSGLFFPVVRLGADFRSPARYDEEVSIVTRLSSVTGARVRFEYTVSRATDGTVLSTGFTEHASVGPNGRPMRLSAELRRRLGGFPGSGE